jgi:uncharacterized protein
MPELILRKIQPELWHSLLNPGCSNEDRRCMFNNLSIPLQTVGLLLVSNVFMTFAWYAHLKDMAAKPLIYAILFSWGLAFFEYVLQVPANRIGYGAFNLAQLKIIQEVITLVVFVPFALYYMNQPLKWDYLWAGLCLMGAVYFIFRS